MIPNWTTFSWSQNNIYCACLILLIIGCFALIRFNDWYRTVKTRTAKTSIGELEALFAIKDYREPRRLRPWEED